ncbi:Cytochrome c oxidase caa3 assembly factor [Nonomuraea coxensis DSM 45129]|uniref:Cytochrome c oxidase caa3 assembly factor n=1 Tax=Nonomuraea coxensis DSM 45129 TaxID=1122611 RepID=A0ABX8TX21_9ACTN|nr:cytochrome c oxidase assembly protein [Nonomuraea coxensis]QYC40045.1 Cytochrome c oxidase caa3 assembly factor [Nonomuraea coxensis DSM 45129]
MTHQHEHAATVASAVPVLLLALALAGGHLVAAARTPGWSRWRAAAFTGGAALAAFALTGPLAAYAAADFRGHMVQHLLVAMIAPLGLVLGAPVTLLLRALPRPYARRLGRLLRARVPHLLAHPVTALVLSTGGMIALYCTPLYRAAMVTPWLHALVHAHFLVSGCLFAWAIAGPDPAPRRPSVPARLVVLGVAVAAHAGLSQLMYAGLWVDLPVPAAQRTGAAEIMYYGGDLAELLLAAVLVAGWRPGRSVAYARQPA